MKLKSAWLVLLLLLSGVSLAQDAAPATGEATLLLKVMGKGSGRILKRAEVKFGETVLMTDPQGQVKVPHGEGLIQVSRQGYASVFVDRKGLAGKSEYSVYLPPGAVDDSEVVITGARKNEVSRKSISVRETERIAPGGDPAQITQLLPGVRSEPGSTEVVIRGSGPNDSRYYVDDILVPSIFHEIGNLSIVPSPQLDNVDFTAGGFGARYGDASGGVIVLRSKEQLPEENRTELVVNVPFYAGAFHERRLSENSAMAVSARRSTLEAILPRVLEAAADEGFEATIIPFFHDAYGRYIWKDENVRYRLTAISSVDGITLAVPSEDSENAEGTFNVEFRDSYSILALEHERKLGDAWRVRTTPQYSYARTKANFGTDKVYLNQQGVSLPTEFTRREGPGRSFVLGFEPTYSQVGIDVAAPLPPPDDDPYFDFDEAPKFQVRRDFKVPGFAAWAAYDIGFDAWLVTPGVRAFRTGLNTETSYDPRLQARYSLNKEDSIKFAVGQYSIAPEPIESSGEFGNPDLNYERSMHYILGWEKNWSERWVADIQGFYKKTIRLVSAGGSKNYQDTGDRLTHGLEVFLRRNMTEKFFGWLSYTYSVSEDRKSESAPRYVSTYDQTHILNLAGSYRISATLDLGLRFKYNSGNPFTPVRGSYYNASFDKYKPIYDEDKPYSERLPDFHALDLFMTYDDLYNEWKMKYQLGVQYIALAPRVGQVSYNYDYSKKEKAQGLPPIPYIQVSASF